MTISYRCHSRDRLILSWIVAWINKLGYGAGLEIHPRKSINEWNARETPARPRAHVDNYGKCKRDNDLRVGTWLVRTLYRSSVAQQRADTLNEFKWICKVQDCIRKNNCDIYYSCHSKRNKFRFKFQTPAALLSLSTNKRENCNDPSWSYSIYGRGLQNKEKKREMLFRRNKRELVQVHVA